jgi:hypothetical protein
MEAIGIEEAMPALEPSGEFWPKPQAAGATVAEAAAAAQAQARNYRPSPPAFDALFRADLTPEVIRFERTDPEGRQHVRCFVELTPLDYLDADEFGEVGVTYGPGGEAQAVDVSARIRWLLPRVVTNWQFARDLGAGLQAEPAPQEPAQRRAYLEALLDPENRDGLAPAFGRWLMGEALRVNGLGAKEQGESPAASGN